MWVDRLTVYNTLILPVVEKNWKSLFGGKMCIVYKLSILNLDVKTFFYIRVFEFFFGKLVDLMIWQLVLIKQVFDIHDLEGTNMQGNHQIWILSYFYKTYSGEIVIFALP